MYRVAVRAGVAAILDKRKLGVGWSQNVVVVQVNRTVELLESHIAMMPTRILDPRKQFLKLLTAAFQFALPDGWPQWLGGCPAGGSVSSYVRQSPTAQTDCANTASSPRQTASMAAMFSGVRECYSSPLIRNSPVPLVSHTPGQLLKGIRQSVVTSQLPFSACLR
jgi:hypothetical protein